MKKERLTTENKKLLSPFLSLSNFPVMSLLRPSLLVPLATAFCLCLCGSAEVALAQQTLTGPTPALNSDLLLTISNPILTPWENGASATDASSAAVGATVARITFGPCVYRTAHWHNLAWEVLTPLSPSLSLTAVMQEPSNAGGKQRTDVVAPGQSIVFPAGWLHLQLNDNCAPLDTLLVFNAVKSGGTSNLPQAIYSLDPAYNQVAFVSPLPAPAPTNWVVDPTCAARCGISSTANSATFSAGTSELKNKLRQTAGLAFSGEQVAAADATALFGQGLKSVLKKDAQLAAAAVKGGAAAAKNATRAVVG